MTDNNAFHRWGCNNDIEAYASGSSLGCVYGRSIYSVWQSSDKNSILLSCIMKQDSSPDSSRSNHVIFKDCNIEEFCKECISKWSIKRSTQTATPTTINSEQTSGSGATATTTAQPNVSSGSEATTQHTSSSSTSSLQSKQDTSNSPVRSPKSALIQLSVLGLVFCSLLL